MTLTLQQFALLVVVGTYVPMGIAGGMIFGGYGLRRALYVSIPVMAAIFAVPYFLGYR